MGMEIVVKCKAHHYFFPNQKLFTGLETQVWKHQCLGGLISTYLLRRLPNY